MIHDIFSGVLKKGYPRQNINSSKKCRKKGSVSKKGGVQKRAIPGVLTQKMKNLARIVSME